MRHFPTSGEVAAVSEIRAIRRRLLPVSERPFMQRRLHHLNRERLAGMHREPGIGGVHGCKSGAVRAGVALVANPLMVAGLVHRERTPHVSEGVVAA